LVLLRVWFALPAALLRRRCAFTAPFHPYLIPKDGAVYSLWHFPSDGLEPGLPDVIRHTALWSSDFPLPASEDAKSDRPLCTVHELLPARHLLSMLYTDCSVVDIECPCCPRIAPCSTLQRFVPFADCSALDSWPSAPCSDCSGLGVSRPVLSADRSVVQHFTRWWRLAQIAPCLTPAFRTGRELLRARHLAFRVVLGLLRARRFPPCAARGSLRRHRLALAPSTNCFVLDTWPSASCSDCSVLVASRPALPADCSAFNA